MKLSQLTLAVSAFALAACATAGMKDSEKLALYRSHAQAPVNSFRYLNRIDGWTPLGKAAVAIWTRPNEAYLLEVAGPCPDLDFAQAISLTSQSGIVYTRFDKIIPRGGMGSQPPIPCPIHEIRPLDVKALKADEKDIRRQREEGGG